MKLRNFFFKRGGVLFEEKLVFGPATHHFLQEAWGNVCRKKIHGWLICLIWHRNYYRFELLKLERWTNNYKLLK